MATLPSDALRDEIKANNAGLEASGYVVPERLLKKMLQWEREFVAAGGLLGAGADPWGRGWCRGSGICGISSCWWKAGFGVEEAAKIMTLNGARILGEEARTGSVEVRMAADLAVARGNVLSQPDVIYEVVSVYRCEVPHRGLRVLAQSDGNKYRIRVVHVAYANLRTSRTGSWTNHSKGSFALTVTRNRGGVSRSGGLREPGITVPITREALHWQNRSLPSTAKEAA